jgi:hypothetical protein
MNRGTKPALYVIFSLLMVVCALLFLKAYRENTKAPEDKDADLTAIAVPETAQKQAPTVKGGNKLGILGAGFMAGAIGLGILAAYDISMYVASRSVKVLYSEDVVAPKDPEYEQAEAEWANGNYLESIRLLREYLVHKPNEVHALIRIAEIYETDLKNLLASALEYEIVLTHKLAPEKWAWTAIHLVNLYNRLNRPADGLALLKRIDAEYGETSAAVKARQRLGYLEESTTAGEAGAGDGAQPT